MFSVIIADDEPYILQALEKKISATGLGFEISGTADNGEECLELVRNMEPDLLICDIRMPGLTGLELMETLKAEHTRTQVIFVSGYSEFEYAKKALDLGALGYLLKPVRPEILQETLEKAALKLTENRASELEEAVKKTESLLDFLSAMPEGTPEELIIRQMACPRRFGLYGVVAVTSPAVGFLTQRLEMEEIEWREYHYSREISFLVLNFSPSAEAKITAALSQLVTPPFPGSAGFSSSTGSLHNIYQRIQEAVLLQYSWFSSAIDRLYHQGDLHSTVLPELLKDFNVLFASRNRSRIHTTLDEISALNRDEPINIQELMDFYNGFIELLHNTALKQGKKDYNLQPVSSPAILVRQFDSLEKMIETLHEQTNILYPERDREESAPTPSIDTLTSIKSYIKNNIDADLNLDHLSEIFGLKKSRISSLFKAETGVSPIEFLRKTRINHACFLLEHTTLPIQEISDLCGIHDYFYFAKVFRKTTGLTATQYRDRKTRK